MIISSSELCEICTSILTKAQVPPSDAGLVADVLVEANLRGHDSHGVIRLPLWVEGLRNSTVKAQPKIKKTNEQGAAIAIDGDYGLGPVVATRGREFVESLAEQFGIGIVSIRKASHLGMLSYYAETTAANGFICIITTNTEPAMAPFGGRERILGTNPICIAAPSRRFPIVLDMSSSVVARGKLLVAKSRGSSILESWALDKTGKPTTDPAAALEGALRPIADHKGAGLAIMIDLLSGALAGAAVTTGVRGTYRLTSPCTKGDCIIAIDPGRLGGTDRFLDLVEKTRDDVVQSTPAPGVDQVLMPGDAEREIRRQKSNDGIPLAEEVVQELERLY